MKKLILVLLTISFFLFINTNHASATNSLDILDDYQNVSDDGLLDNNILLSGGEESEDYQEGYRQGYEDGFSHKNRVKIALWQYEDIRLTELDTVYRFNYNDFVATYQTISARGLTEVQIRQKIFVPTFDGFVGGYNASVRQWFLGTANFHLYVEKEIIQSIMSRDSVDEITALRTYLEENNIHGYFERASGLTDYEIGYNDGYDSAMEDTTTKLMSSIIILISPIFLISVILQLLNRFKNDN